MKLLITLIILFLPATSLFAERSINPATTDLPPLNESSIEMTLNDLAQINTLIQMTEKTLQSQIILRERLNDFLEAKTRYNQDPQNKGAVAALLKSSRVLFDQINNNQLSHHFRPELISELAGLTQISKKKESPAGRR
jgi:hypothetical protein